MKSTSRDIWAIPPGGFETRPKRGWIKPAIAGVLVLSLGVGGGAIYASMKRSTEVSTQDAVAQFRAEAQQAQADQESSDPDATDPRDKRRAHRSDRSKGGGGADQQSTGGGNSAAVAADDGGAPVDSNAQQSSSNDKARKDTKRTAVASQPTRPEDGVYSWAIEGYERAPGIQRKLPRRSHRIISYEGDREWVEHHIYSEQKEQWFHLGSSDQGVAVSEVRNRVEMGPVTVDETVMYNPSAYVSRFPFKLNQTWKGSWDGDTRGTYTGKTIDHGTIVIGGTEVEVWVTEVKMEMRGDMEGTALTRSWVAPDHSIVVKQYQETRVKSGPGEYYCEWEGQLTSLRPQR